ncbi:unnamed protein product [Absidia cylindrospora]
MSYYSDKIGDVTVVFADIVHQNRPVDGCTANGNFIRCLAPECLKVYSSKNTTSGSFQLDLKRDHHVISNDINNGTIKPMDAMLSRNSSDSATREQFLDALAVLFIENKSPFSLYNSNSFQQLINTTQNIPPSASLKLPSNDTLLTKAFFFFAIGVDHCTFVLLL